MIQQTVQKDMIRITYVPRAKNASAETESRVMDGQEIDALLATKKAKILIPCSTDYIQITKLSCECTQLGENDALTMHSPREETPLVTLYPGGEAYDVDAAIILSKKQDNFFADRCEELSKLKDENILMLVLTRGGNIKALQDSDILLRAGEDGMWWNTTDQAKTYCALVRQ